MRKTHKTIYEWWIARMKRTEFGLSEEWLNHRNLRGDSQQRVFMRMEQLRSDELSAENALFNHLTKQAGRNKFNKKVME